MHVWHGFNDNKQRKNKQTNKKKKKFNRIKIFQIVIILAITTKRINNKIPTRGRLNIRRGRNNRYYKKRNNRRN